MTRITISLPKEMLARMDALAQERGETRSAFVRRGLEQTLEGYEARKVLAQAQALYAEIEETDRRLAEDFLSISAETLPPYSDAEAEQ